MNSKSFNNKQTLVSLAIALIVLALLLWASFGASLDRGATNSSPDAAVQVPAAKPGQKSTAGNSGKKTGAKQASKVGGSRSRGPTTVVLAAVTEGVTNDRLNAIGNGEALASVSVVPLSNGVLTDVLVVSGQQVSEGDVLARMDSEAEVIALDRAVRAISDTTSSLVRFQTLRKSRSVTQVQLDQGETDLENAKLAERDARLKLERRSIVAPIAGIVGIVAVQRGDFVTTQSEIATIDDRSSVIVDFWVPERFASLVSIGQSVEATAYAVPGKAFKGIVNAVGSRVEQDSRTMQVRAEIDNQPDTLRPGMSFSVKMRFAGNTFPAVDPLAVQWDSDGSYVWQATEGKVKRQSIRIIQRNPEAVLVEGALSVNDEVVVQGVLSLRNGGEVREAGAQGSSGNTSSKSSQSGS